MKVPPENETYGWSILLVALLFLGVILATLTVRHCAAAHRIPAATATPGVTP